MRIIKKEGKKMKKIFICLLLITGVYAANVGNSDGGKIVHIASVEDVILFRIKGNTELNRPNCADTKRFSVKKDSSHSAVVLVAFTSGKTLGNVKGLGKCSLWENAEDLRWIEVCPLTGC